LSDLKFLLTELERDLIQLKPTRKKARASHKKVPKPSALSFDEFKLRKEAQTRIKKAEAINKQAEN
jgi:hypothetical protein